MKDKIYWKSNEEHRISLRTLLYECKKEEPRKSYDQIGEEFGISGRDANSLVVEHCKKLSLDEPPVVLLPGTHYEKNNKLPIATRVEFEGKQGVLIEEFYHHYKVLLDETSDFVYVSRIDLSIS